MNLVINDFYPISNWKPDVNGRLWNCCQEHRGIPRFIIDLSTNRRYLNEDSGTVRFKCFLLVLGTPFVHLAAGVTNMGFRIFKILSGNSLEDGAKSAGIDLLRIVLAPLTLVGLELAAIYGIFMPYDGRKLYATIERAEYGHFILAPCFQPEAEKHAFGGNIDERNAF